MGEGELVTLYLICVVWSLRVQRNIIVSAIQTSITKHIQLRKTYAFSIWKVPFKSFLRVLCAAQGAPFVNPHMTGVNELLGQQ